MERIHLFEFEDQNWFPSFIRNYGTDFLQFLSNKTALYKPIVPLFVLWDGVISSFRTYSVSEMQKLLKNLRNVDSYIWELNRLKSGPGIIIYMTGFPIAKS